MESEKAREVERELEKQKAREAARTQQLEDQHQRERDEIMNMQVGDVFL